MYNRILKRPMFRRGGPSYQSQGTGITSPYDVPRGGYYGGGTIGGGIIHGNPMGNRTGFKEPELEVNEVNIEDFLVDNTAERLKAIGVEKEKIFETPKGTWLNDVIGSFGAYSTPYKDDGTAKTIGEMGAEQAASITAIRKERKDKQDLAKLSGLESEEAGLIRKEEQANKVAIANLEGQIGKESALAVQRLQNAGAISVAKIAHDPARTATGMKIKELKALLEKGSIGQEEYDQRLKDILSNTSLGHDITILAAAIAKSGMVSGDEAMIQAIGAIQALQEEIYKTNKATGGRVGYQMGTPQTGAMMPMQASATETIDTPGEDMTMTETVTEGQQSTVQMPYQEFRAALPAEVSDEIVQLIYYNQDAFADFSQITTQSDVYAFNNKYGVSLVLPMDTETT